MSLSKNIAANYISQIYITLIGVIFVPYYVRVMGAEAYGLVGFFAMLQGWFNLLDIGLSATLSRESSRYHGGAVTAVAYRQLYRYISLIFLVLSVVGGGVLWSGSQLITSRWLHAKELSSDILVLSVKIMAVNIALRCFGGVYRGIISGAERFVWNSSFNILIASARFIGVLASMAIWGYTPTVFFWHQLVVATLEVVVLVCYGHSLVPGRKLILSSASDVALVSILPSVKFALSIGFSSTVWLMVTQTDKLILSGLLSLTQYGYFALAMLVANGINMINVPISSSLMPRLARLYAEKKQDEMLHIYQQTTQLVVVIGGAIVIALVSCAHELLYAWSGNRVIADNAAPILQLYAIGNGFLLISAFPYYLQYAMGSLRYHNINDLVTIVILVPTISIITSKFGAVGAGWTWLAFHLVGLLFWSWFVHSKLAPGLHRRWLWDSVVIIIPIVAMVSLVTYFKVKIESRFVALCWVTLVSLVSLTTALVASPVIREKMIKKISSY